MVVPGCRLLSSIYEEANHPLTLDLGIFFFVAEQGEQEGTRYIEEHFWGATMAP